MSIQELQKVNSNEKIKTLKHKTTPVRLGEWIKHPEDTGTSSDSVAAVLYYVIFVALPYCFTVPI